MAADRNLYWRLSTFYFAYFALLGGFAPYWSVYLDALGYSGAQIGLLLALTTGTKIITPNLWGWLADHTGNHLRLIRIGALGTALVFGVLLFEPGYLGLALSMLAFGFFWNAIISQYEVVTLRHLGTGTDAYSRIRLWGSVGFILTVAGLGYVLDHVSALHLPWLLYPLVLLILLSTSLISAPPAIAREHETSSFRNLFWRRESLAFFSCCALLQVSHGPYYTLFSLYLEQYGYSRVSIGLLWALGVAMEIGLFLLMPRLLPRIGPRRLILLALGLTCMRWWLIGCYAEQLAVLIFAQCLHAFSFGAFHAAAIEWIHRRFGAGHGGKGQALYSSASFGVGGATGALMAGYSWDWYGPVTGYALAAFAAALALLLAWRFFNSADTGPAEG